jgi:oligogalacturonide lyase
LLYISKHLNPTTRLQQSHPHPRFTSDGKKVLYTTNVSGYCNVYLVDVPEFESLPAINNEIL